MKSFLYLSVFVLIFTLSIVTVQDVYAVRIDDLKNAGSCTAIYGTWTPSTNTCTLTSNFDLGFRDSLIIEPGITLKIPPSYTLGNSHEGGTITIKVDGTIDNYGTIYSYANYENLLHPPGAIAITTINNYGTINNYLDIINTSYINVGATQYGIIHNFGLINNKLTGNIHNDGGTIDGGAIFNEGTIENIKKQFTWNNITNIIGKFSVFEYCGTGQIIGYASSGPVTCPTSIISIKADDPSASINEGNSNTSDFFLTVTRSGSLLSQSFVSTVDYETADYTAVSPSDYAYVLGHLVFAKDEKTKPITVQVNGDTTYEQDEFFNVNLKNCVVCHFNSNHNYERVEIRNDDPNPTPPLPVYTASPWILMLSLLVFPVGYALYTAFYDQHKRYT